MIRDNNTYQRQNGRYTVHTHSDAIDLDIVCGFLKTTTWAAEFSREALKEAFKNSLCFSLRKDSEQIGFARVITDQVTYAYLCDVLVLEAHRGQGLGTFLIRSVMEDPRIAPLKRIALITHDAQAFYRRIGFSTAPQPDMYMEKLQSSRK